MSKKKAGSRKAAKENKTPDPSPEEEEDEAILNAFMTEIESDLRDEQLQQFWDTYKNFVFAGLAALILGVSGYQYWAATESDRLATQADTFAQAAEDLEAGNTESAIAGLASVAQEGGAYGALAQLRRAAVMLEQGNTDEAVNIYRSLSEDVTLDFAFTDLATVLWALHGIDIEDPATLEDALSSLTSPSNAYSYSALELMAVLSAKRGDLDNAINLLEGLLADTNTPSSVRARAEELSAVYKSPVAVSSAPSAVAP